MRRTLFLILGTVGALVALVFVAVAVAIWRIDPNDFIAPIQARIRQATGRDVAIRGGVELKLSLTPKLVVRDLAVGNAPWGSAPQLLAARELEIEVALLPLLRRRFEVTRVDLIEPVIALETDGKGQANWDFGTATTLATPGAAAGPLSPASFGVGNIGVANGRLSFRDGRSGAITSVAIESLALSARDAQSPVNAQFRGTVDGVAVALTGSLGPLDALVQRRWPYPVALTGEIEGQKANVATKLRMDGPALQFDDLDLALGPNALKGTLTVTTGGARPLYTFKLAVPTYVLGQGFLPVIAAPGAAAATSGGGSSAGSPGGSGKFILPDAPLPLARLRAFDAVGELAIGKLQLPGGREVANVEAQLELRDGRLDVRVPRGATLGGQIEAKATLDAPASGGTAISLDARGRELDAGAVLAAFGVRRDVRGGKTSVDAAFRARGSSLHEWASTASGNVLLVVGPATIANAKLDAASVFDRLAQSANPFRDKDPTTELRCAVLRLPLADGVAHVDRSIGIESQKLGITVSGTLDFRSETLDLSFKPQLREGIPIEFPQVAELVRLRGTFARPEVVVDAMASVSAVARIGAAVGSGGISELGVAALGAARRAGPGPCAVAMGASAAASPTPAASAPQATAADPIGQALGRLFRR